MFRPAIAVIATIRIFGGSGLQWTRSRASTSVAACCREINTQTASKQRPCVPASQPASKGSHHGHRRRHRCQPRLSLSPLSPQERQHLQQCALHSLNNLFQDTTCSRAELDAIASQMAPGVPPLPFLHPHRCYWGTALVSFGQHHVHPSHPLCQHALFTPC